MSTPKTQFRSMPAEDDHEFDADMPTISFEFRAAIKICDSIFFHLHSMTIAAFFHTKC